MKTEEVCYTAALTCLLLGVLITGGALDSETTSIIAVGIGMILIGVGAFLTMAGWIGGRDTKK